MKHGKFKTISNVSLLIIGTLLLQTVVWAFYDLKIFYVMLILSLVVSGYTIFRLLNIQKHVSRVLRAVNDSINTEGSDALSRLTIPVLVVSDNDEIIWYNNALLNFLPEGTGVFGESINVIISPEDKEILEREKQANIFYNNKYFTVFETCTNVDGVAQKVYYFFDITDSVKNAQQYALSRPAVALVAIDNLDELTRDAKDSEKALIISTIEKEIENWSASSNGISRKLSTDRYMLIFEERHLQKIMEERFSVLDTVRSLNFEGRGRPTLSIGVGHNAANLRECEEFARQALDMALGRGGDQAAVKNRNNEFEFFGGVSKSVEKRSKVRARIVASAIKELIEGSDRVLLMGHRFADLDCFGAAYSLWSCVKSMGKEAHIIMDTEKNLAKTLLDRIVAQGITDVVTDGKQLLPLIDKKTMLIILDTHKPDFLESQDIYKACETVVVIDHHRKSVDHIDNAVIFYHETSASSTCEMVTELLQYMGEKTVGKLEAEALLSGIMLDTRNFVLHTGVRTFEASAFLINHGADPVQVKYMLAGNISAYRQRANIISNAEIYGDCAISENRENDEHTLIATSQAADELLNISGVNAAFVLCWKEGKINISARSLGKINVQLIMEELGGGGHRTMAACQLEVTDFEEAKTMLISAIDSYKNKNGQSVNN
ncbi:MAG TPA: DHH family phosphoesterase [Clostridiales bacterium]|nr:DHH family phosphoesterase [Clostridiales bacterium]